MYKKMNKLNYFIFFLLIVLSCKKDAEVKVEDKKIYPNMIQKNYRHFIYKNGKKYLYAYIDYAEFFEKKNTIEADYFYGEIYNSENKIITKINADKAVVNKSIKQIILTGNVIVELLEHKTKMYSKEFVLEYEINLFKSEYEVLFMKEDGSYLKTDLLKSDIKKETTKFENFELKYYYDEDQAKGDNNDE